MSDITRGIVQGYLDAFGTYTITSPSLRQQTEEFKRKMVAFADANPDASVFYQKLAESGLQEEYSGLITKVAMASMGTADADGNVKTDYSDTPAPPPVSVRDFVEQYRVPYNEIKKAGYRKRGEAAYEKIFAVADKTSDMLDAQMILEKERLLWKIVSEDSLDVFEPILQAMDPLQTAMTITLEKHVEAYKKAQGSEELDYIVERLEFEKIALTQKAVSRMNMAILLASLLMDYCSNKLNTQCSGGQGEQGKKALHAMIDLRSALRRALQLLKEELGLTFDDLLADEGLKIWLLIPKNVDELGRIKESLHPQNYDVFRDIIRDEILSDLSIPEILSKTPDQMIWYGFDRAEQNAFHNKAVDKAKQLNAHLTYYQYREQLAQASRQHVPKTQKKQPHQAINAMKKSGVVSNTTAAFSPLGGQQLKEQAKGFLKGLFGKNFK
ncbi:MAG: hypothetical protein ACOX8Q_05500 [Christensenellales bacterium]